MLIRKETPADIPAIHFVVRNAFDKDGEPLLVRDLRESGSLCLSLVAADGDAIIGHIAFSPMSFDGTAGLAPLAVTPAQQHQGIGRALVMAGIAEMKSLGFGALFVLGSEKYYPRFGFKPAKQFDIRCVYPDSENHFFAMELKPGALDGMSGIIHYAPEFGKL